MRRILPLLFALALVLAACSGEGGSATTTDEAGPTSTEGQDAVTTTVGRDDGESTSTTTPDGTTTQSDRPLAPDFTLELGDGGSYTLSEGAKPVYLVFWAEW